MMNESVYQWLRSHLKGEADEHLLTFTANNANGQSILFMSLEQFCSAAGVDEGRALRFFSSFGLNSFVGFKRLLRESLYCDMTEQGVVSRSISSIADEVIRYELQNLADLSRTIDTVQIRRLAQDILSASNVVILFQSMSSPPSHTLARAFRTLGINYMVATKARLDTSDLSALDHTALLIAFGFPRYAKDALMRLKQLKQQGIRIVSVTDNPESPFAFLSDYYFTLPARSFDFTDSHSASTAFISILSITIGMLERERVFDRLQAQETKLDDMNMFF